MDDHLLSNLIPEFNDPSETLHDLSYSSEIEEGLEEDARCRREAIERDELQTEGIRELVKQAKGASIMAIIAIAISIIGLVIGIAALIKT